METRCFGLMSVSRNRLVGVVQLLRGILQIHQKRVPALACDVVLGQLIFFRVVLEVVADECQSVVIHIFAKAACDNSKFQLHCRCHSDDQHCRSHQQRAKTSS
eukprot:g8613.t1